MAALKTRHVGDGSATRTYILWLQATTLKPPLTLHFINWRKALDTFMTESYKFRKVRLGRFEAFDKQGK